MDPIVSIIVPTYNRYSYLGATIDSILCQTYTKWECIVVDDSSSDYTEELMQFYCELDYRVSFVKRPTKNLKGANACRNYGFSKSSGEFVNWFDSDDIMHPNFLTEKLIKLSRNVNSICCISSFQTFKILKKERVLGNTSKLGKENIFENICLQKYSVPTNGPLWRRSYLEKIELFNEDLSISQDFEFHSRALKNDELIEIITKPLFYLRVGNQSITQEFYLNISQHFYSYFIVRKKIISDYKDNKVITDFLKSDLMGMFRYLLALKDFQKSRAILNYLSGSTQRWSFLKRLDFFKVYVLYYLIRIIGGGETRLKRYLYLSHF